MTINLFLVVGCEQLSSLTARQPQLAITHFAPGCTAYVIKELW